MLTRKVIKSLLSILLITFTIMILGACVPHEQSFNDIDARIFSAHMKPYPSDETGKKAVLHGERIYYLSGELGQQGIYSMRLDGSDIQFEFPVEDIRAIQMKEDGFYYCGYRNTGSNYNGTYWIGYTKLYRKDKVVVFS